MSAEDLLSQGLNALPVQLPRVIAGRDWQVFVQLAQAGPVYLAGQPGPDALRRFAAEGVTTVVNLRRPEEMEDPAQVPFDEVALIRELGMDYVSIPLGGEAFPYTPAALERFAVAMAATEEKLLLHCTVALRVSYLWVAYLLRYHDFPLDRALEHGRVIHHAAIPLEDLLYAH